MPDIPNRPFHMTISNETNPIVEKALETFQQFDPKFDNHAEARQLDFWLTALKVQIAEIEAARTVDDWMKVAWELTDVITVAIDALAKTGKFGIWKMNTPHIKSRIICGIIEERLAINKTKAQEMVHRDAKFYEDKLKELQSPSIDKWEAKVI